VQKVGYADASFYEHYDLYLRCQVQFPLGAHSLVADPMFVNVGAGDFHLTPGSPAVDSGVDVGLTADFDGGHVPHDGNSDGIAVVDRGAFELGSTGAAAPSPTAPGPTATAGSTPTPPPPATPQATPTATAGSAPTPTPTPPPPATPQPTPTPPPPPAPTPTPSPTPTPATSPSGSVSSGTPCVGAARPAQWKHVVVLMFENHTYDQVIGALDSSGSLEAPYITGLARKCGSYQNWYDANYRDDGSVDGNYVSKPSYATLTSGLPPSVHGLLDDTSSTKTSVDNIYNELRLAGKNGKES